MKRKLLSLLLSCALLLSLTVCLAGCGDSASSNGVVNICNWGEYIDEDLLDKFTQETGIKVNYDTFSDNESLYSILSSGSADYDLIIPSDYMISRMISEDMLEPLNFDNIPNYQYIDEAYRGLEFDPNNTYSVAYTWGTVGIIYNTTMLDYVPDSWSVLWDESLSGQILMFDNSRDAIGIALKYLGYSQNSTDASQITEAVDLLIQQKPLVQSYVMDQIFDKLEGGEAAVGPYYAGDAITMIDENPDLAFVVPKEGTNLFVDAMCIPKGAANQANAEAFINFICDPENMATNIEYIGYSSPSTAAKELLSEELRESEIAYPDESLLTNTDTFINLPQETLDLYDSEWVRLMTN
jgi:spermidine/putrescine transport system substrate-binding protein